MSGRKLFGTDGIRGKANVYPMTCEIAIALGRAVTHYFQTHSPVNKKPLIILGKDTRLSCYMLEQAFSAGVCSQGGKVILTGPLPTPGVAFVTESMRADAGVVISASHNNYADNGIKIFDSKGYKLPDDVELEIERMVLNPELVPVKSNENLGNAKRLDEVIGRYIVHVKSAFASSYGLDNMRVVIDCANGASYKVAPMVFSELGAEVFAIGVSPNGTNINLACGSTHPELCRQDVIKYKADVGVTLDGDADRVIIVDELGSVVDGDQVIGLTAMLMLDQKIIKKGDVVVGTVMSNLGLEQFIKNLGLNFERTQVGDRYIIEKMKETGALLGGEPSGHVIIKSHSTTGDGILAALKVIEASKYYGKTISELVEEIKLFPQALINVPVKKKMPIDDLAGLQKVMSKVKKELGQNGRFLLRYSGTENLLRVMVEANDPNLVDKSMKELVEAVQVELGKGE